ncbi:hypothetical protein OK016_05785 [Vibrio chagasii]|nr:hypothetical protein [Vibrio chagasii]
MASTRINQVRLAQSLNRRTAKDGIQRFGVGDVVGTGSSHGESATNSVLVHG